MEEIRTDGERNVKKMIADIDKKIIVLREEQEVNDVRLREKEQEVKLYDLRIREIKRSQILIQSQ
jgi:hypothetical protein